MPGRTGIERRITMNTMLRSTNAPQQTALAPSSLTTTGHPVAGSKVSRGVWIGGGLMALTIVALATALVMKGGNSGVETPAQLAAVPAPTVTAPAPAPVVVAPAPVVAEATPPVVEPAQAPAPAHHTVRHTPTHSTTSTSESGSTGNTTVASTGGNAPVANPSPAPAPAPVCTTCGVVDSYDSVQVAGNTNGVGAVAGGVGGAVLGSQIAGRHNKTLGGVIGAIGGGLLGNAIEKHERTTTMYDVHVRMNDGSMRTVRQSTIPQVGSHVSIEGNTLHAAPQGGSSYQGSTAATGGNGGSSFSPSGS
jgi:outer membrane lipoprotein SlyB